MNTLLVCSYFILGLVCLGMAQDKPIFRPKPWLKTVSELDESKYIGRWFQMYGNRFGWLQYADAVCNTADYKRINATSISVRNTGTKTNVDGEPTEILGVATKTDKPGQYRLKLATVSFEGSYWVLKLGPVINGQYEYAVVSSEGGLTLYVLARDIDRFKKYEQEVLNFLKEQRYDDYLSEPVLIYQGHDCKRVPFNTEMPDPVLF